MSLINNSLQKIKDNISICIANRTDIESIMNFIDNEWKSGHILARNREFFEYEYVHNEDVNFALARNLENEIVGLLGFILYSDTKNGLKDVAPVLWKVAENCKIPALGLRILDYVLKMDKVRTSFTLGINTKTIGIYKYLDMYTGVMDHYVIINSKIPLNDFKIAVISKKIVKNEIQLISSEYEFTKETSEVEIANFKFQEFIKNVPYKDYNYFIKRFLNHPIYKYRISSIRKYGDLVGLIVYRIQEYKGASVIRMVDYFGAIEHLQYATEFLYDLVERGKYEYLDFYCFGFSQQILVNSGFLKVEQNDKELIVPNYFDPFVQSNVEINFYANTKIIDLIRICKADGDQDRPS